MIHDIYLLPTRGDFPAEHIERFVEALPHTFRDPENPHVFLVSRNADLADYNGRKNAEDPEQFPSSALLIKVYPGRIDISWRRDPPEQARAFVRWMLEHHAPRIEDESDNDLTAACAGGLEVLFGK